MFRKNGEVNKNLFIWAAISAFRSRFFEETSTKLPKKSSAQVGLQKLRKHNYAKQKIITLYFSGFRGRIVIDVSFQ
jgi:hypothetical protein